MKGITNEAKREHEVKKPYVCFKKFNDSKNMKVWD